MEYGCIGEKLGHSFSREIHLALCDYAYELKEIAREDLGAFLTEKNFRGINVTIPYKEMVMPYLDEIDEAAARIGAVNTVVNRGGRLLGYNTDFAGMRDLIARAGLALNGKKVLIAGSGGTSKTALAVAQSLGATQVIRVSRSGAEELCTYEEAKRKHRDAGIWINATPCGMFPKAGVSPVDLNDYPDVTGVLDAIYNPLSSRLVLEARGRGIPAAGGLYMLVAQAARAAEYFTEKDIPPAAVERVYRNLVRQKENLVLVGMPGSGKTTIGKIVAQRLGMDFVDTDEALTEQAGMTPAQLIENKGEAAFRDLEQQVIRDLSARHHTVLATGGGAILREENVLNLKGNGRIAFLDRPLEHLAVTADRPLSSDREKLRRRYEERYDLYRGAADLTLPCVDDLETNVEHLIEEFTK